ncbi:MAG: FAD-dependent monooxygenase [Candidatus Dadabacteria bacterium]
MSGTGTGVLIVGAGPTGLTMACELARRGVPFRIIDKAAGPSDKSKAFGIHARTMEVFENMGLIDSVLDEGNICNGFDIYDRGRALASLSFSSIESKYPYLLILAQSDTERVLNERLESYGAKVEREKELTHIDRGGETLVSHIRHSDGSEETIRSSYVSGCDGAHSSVRHILGFEFKGAPYPNYWLLADCNLDWEYPFHHLSAFIHPNGITAYFPLYKDRGRLMFELQDAPVTEEMPEPTLDDVKRLMAEREIKYKSLTDPNWLAYFKLHHRMVDRYADGRIFLSGDAAHIHSPMGGQGMNTGIQDAYNLAWKLALVLEGRGAYTLLESYQAERLPVGKEVVSLTDKATRMAGTHNPILGAIRNKVIGVASRINAVQDRLLATLAQIEIHYKESPIVSERWYQPDTVEGYHGYRDDLTAGERVRDYSLKGRDGGIGTLYGLLKNGLHNLLLFTGGDPEDMELDELRNIHDSIAVKYEGVMAVHVIAGPRGVPDDFKHMSSVWTDGDLRMHKDFGAARASLYLVRPDGYVGFRNQPASLEDLDEYLPGIFV